MERGVMEQGRRICGEERKHVSNIENNRDLAVINHVTQTSVCHHYIVHTGSKAWGTFLN
jgi:hypothetical protein